MNSHSKLKMAVVAGCGLLMSGGAFAGAPLAFDQYSVTAGVITDTSAECAGGGWTCVSLDATGLGILTQQVTDPVSGISYLRTINVESDANGTPAVGLGFAVESQVYANGINSNNIALKQRINEDNMLMTAEIYENAFRSDGSVTDPSGAGTGAGAEMLLIQNVAGTIFQQKGVNSNVSQRLDQVVGAGAAGRFTYAVVASNGQGLFEPTVGGTLGGTTMPSLSYAAGDALSVIWLGADIPGTGDASTRQFGFQEYRNFGAATGATVLAGTAVAVGTSRLLSNELDPDQPGWIFTENGSWDWDSTIFDLGAAPTGP